MTRHRFRNEAEIINQLRRRQHRESSRLVPPQPRPVRFLRLIARVATQAA